MIDKLEQTLGLEAGSIAKAINGEEVNFDLDSFHIASKSDYDTLIGNYEKELEQSKSKFQKEGQTVGIEMAVKNARKELGLDFEGKTMENLLTAYKDKLASEFTQEPNDRIALLTKDKEGLQASYKELEAKLLAKDEEISSIHSEYKKKADDVLISEMLRGEGDKFSKKTHYKSDDLVDLFKLRNKMGVENGEVVFYDNENNVIQNKLKNPVSLSEMYDSFMTDGGFLKKAQGGKAGGDEMGGSGKYTFEQFDKSMEAKGIKTGSEQYNIEMNKAMDSGVLEV